MFECLNRHGAGGLVFVLSIVVATTGCGEKRDESQANENSESNQVEAPSSLNRTPRKASTPIDTTTVLNGVVYVSKLTTPPHLALETENGEVYLIVGQMQAELSRLRNRKVQVRGYVHRRGGAEEARDSLEVIQYHVVHGEGD